jgi:EAL domain-containing protein (putative c-di-GMP-specific phosphodiesterase class I)
VQVELTDIVADVTAALEASGLPARRLEIEITEGVFVKNFEAVVEKLRALRKLGVSVALDDFGTGYSSLSYLGQLPIDRIKIDQSFVGRLPADLEAGAIVRAVAALSDTLGKLVIAEGIETADQAWMLEMAGCQQGQGYHFGKPMQVRELIARLHGRLRVVASAG